ncbi:MAG: hypothetical protein SFU98_00900 [Leptospiraceae bacterium]|nr:hypothetical protein [Leptospiraceae bacterium]
MKILLYFCLAIIFGCKPSQLKIDSVELCGNFTSEGVCKEALNKEHLYEIKVARDRRFDTWDALSNYLYFKSRETPGFLIRFNRKFTITEQKELKRTYQAYYEFSGSRGIMEGVEFGENWIGSFQYLGSILKQRQNEKKESGYFPNLGNVFPNKLNMNYYSEYGTGKISTDINIKILNEE